MKTCSKCKVPKNETEFHTKTNGKLDYQCKECHREYVRKHYDENQQYYVDKAIRAKKKKVDWYNDFKSKLKCEVCGESHPATLDFNHKDPSKKDFAVAAMVNRYSIKRILEEVQKCQVLCANCHRKFHWNQTHTLVA